MGSVFGHCNIHPPGRDPPITPPPYIWGSLWMAANGYWGNPGNQYRLSLGHFKGINTPSKVRLEHPSNWIPFGFLSSRVRCRRIRWGSAGEVCLPGVFRTRIVLINARRVCLMRTWSISPLLFRALCEERWDACIDTRCAFVDFTPAARTVGDTLPSG